MEKYHLLRQNHWHNGLTLKHFIALDTQESEWVREWRNNPAVLPFMYNQNITSPKAHKKFIEDLKNSTERAYWAVFDSQHEGLGVISLTRVQFLHSYAFLGIYVAPKQQHKGVGQQLLKALEYLSFDALGLHSLRLEVFEENTRARAFYARNAFVQEGCLRDFAYINGVYKNIILMGKINANS